jgi:hypothetical protein
MGFGWQNVLLGCDCIYAYIMLYMLLDFAMGSCTQSKQKWGTMVGELMAVPARADGSGMLCQKKLGGGGGGGAGGGHTAQAERQHDCVRMMLACWELVVVGH